MLAYNRKNPVTDRLELVEFEGHAAVRKVLSCRNRADTTAEWRVSSDPAHWNYWRREADAYGGGLAAALEGTGVRMPRVLARRGLSDGNYELVLERIDGRFEVPGARVRAHGHLRLGEAGLAALALA